jgi:hypothetical protein
LIWGRTVALDMQTQTWWFEAFGSAPNFSANLQRRLWPFWAC